MRRDTEERNPKEVIRFSFSDGRRPELQLGAIVTLFVTSEEGLREVLQGKVVYTEEYASGSALAVETIYRGSRYRAEVYMTLGREETDMVKLCLIPPLS